MWLTLNSDQFGISLTELAEALRLLSLCFDPIFKFNSNDYFMKHRYVAIGRYELAT